MKEDASFSCECEKCINCCKRMPGLFKPEQVSIVAKFMNLSLKDFLERYCIVGWRDNALGGNEFIEFVYPARVGFQNMRDDWSYPLGRGRCIFLSKEDNCAIHPVKPEECKLTFGCRKQTELRIRNMVLKTWLNAELDREIVDFISKHE